MSKIWKWIHNHLCESIILQHKEENRSETDLKESVSCLTPPNLYPTPAKKGSNT